MEKKPGTPRKKALLVGNDINNLTAGYSWSNLLTELKDFCCGKGIVIEDGNKPFPLLYEEIFLRSTQVNPQLEIDVKRFIAGKFKALVSGPIHDQIMAMDVDNIMTTNYDFALEGQTPKRNNGVIPEKAYSVFRHSLAKGKKVWHVHGDLRTPASINLGFEHYGGQLQHIRNYVASGTSYSSDKLKDTRPFIVRWQRGKEPGGHSWTELFFTDDIYIFGFRMDFVETDIWWLLTYRARQLFTPCKSGKASAKAKKLITNRIYYFIPSEFVPGSKEKIDLLKVSGVEVIDQFSGKDRVQYYQEVLEFIADAPKQQFLIVGS